MDDILKPEIPPTSRTRIYDREIVERVLLERQTTPRKHTGGRRRRPVEPETQISDEPEPTPTLDELLGRGGPVR